MRFAYVLLGLVTLTSFHASIGDCSNGVPGLEAADVCCEEQCGTCAGSGCSSRPGGVEACCLQAIRASGTMCSTTSEAPCIIDGRCTNGVPGVQFGNICCEDQCGTCGRPGCGSRPGGEGACCASNIRQGGTMCSTTREAPCIVDDLCSNGVFGVEFDDICCENQCGTCAQAGCSARPGGVEGCCGGTIRASGAMCSDTNAAPCIMDT